jgi:hypothetical protein
MRVLEMLEKLEKELRVMRAHTYASENADHYRGFDAGIRYAAERIKMLRTNIKNAVEVANEVKPD